MKMPKYLLATSMVCAPLCSIAPQAQAQAADAAKPSTDTGDIIVTAQKRSESVRNVGMSITAVSGDQLKTIGVNGVAGITRIDPSFVVLNSTYGAPVYAIRGISFNNYSLAASPVVSVYSDEVPYAYAPMTKGATYDLARVEVLKGPQGTLFGESSTAGAINYISAKPTRVLAAGLDASYGSFNAANFNGFISGPITGNLAARLAFDVDEGGAWQKSATRDDRLGNRDTQKARLILDWNPTDRLSIELNVNGWLDHSDTQAGQFVALNPQTAKYLSLFPALTSAKAPPQDDRYADWQPGLHPRLDEHYAEASARVEYRLSDHATLTYLGSYQVYAQDDLRDNGGTATEANYLFHGRVDSYTQEARLSGDVPSAHLKWLAGASYQDNITADDQIYDVAGGTTSYAYVNLKLAAQPYSHFSNLAHDDAKAAGLFGNLTWAPLETLSLHGGARYTDNRINHGGCTVGDANYTTAINNYEKYIISITPGSGPYTAFGTGDCSTLGTHLTPTYVNQSLDQHNVSWRAGVDWKPLPGTLAYAAVSQGYKAGSFPTLTAVIYSQLAPVVEESLLSYEAGVKSRLFGGLADIDADVFYYDYHNKQLEGRALTQVGIATLLVNIPKSYEVGAELGLTLHPIKGLALDVKQTWLHSRIQGYTPGFDGFGLTTNFEGQPFAQAPSYAAVGDGQYTWSVSSRYNAFFGVNFSYRTHTPSLIGTYGYNVAPYQIGDTEIRSYALLGLRAGIVTADDRWRFEVSGDNVTNTYYWTSELKQSDAVVRYTGMPATFRIRVSYKY